MTLSKPQLIIQLSNKVGSLEDLKNNLSIEIPHGHENAYGLCKLKDIPAKTGFGDLKNGKGKTFSESIQYIEDQYHSMVESYIEELKKEMEKI